MACDYVLLPRAQEDFEEIVRYLSVELDSKRAAVRFVEEIESKVLLACEYPEIHPLSQMPEAASRGYRVMPVMSYVVPYAYRDGRVVIAHIFHSLQDYARYV